ncbi:hypothetical protein HK405_016022 [Cladochytrium tenue]|nr:hypothetical protein HK405_016022 [Cladochytrium tenue]
MTPGSSSIDSRDDINAMQLCQLVMRRDSVVASIELAPPPPPSALPTTTKPPSPPSSPLSPCAWHSESRRRCAGR